MFFPGIWSSIPHFQLPLYLPAPAWSLPLRLQLAFLPQRFLSQHDPQSISHSLIAQEVHFSPFLGCKLLFGSQTAQCPKGMGSFCFQATLAFIRLMTSLGGQLCWFAIFASWKWCIVLFWSIDHCGLCWFCCWARCWMLQVMDNMEASCVFYVTVGTFTHLEQSKISLLTVNKFGIVKLTIQPDVNVSVSLMWYPRDDLRQTSVDVLCLEHHPNNI